MTDRRTCHHVMFTSLLSSSVTESPNVSDSRFAPVDGTIGDFRRRKLLISAAQSTRVVFCCCKAAPWPLSAADVRRNVRIPLYRQPARNATNISFSVLVFVRKIYRISIK